MQAYDITPNAWYPTFGDTPGKRKFRLIFFFDTLITELNARNYLMDALFAMYPEADKACKNPAHYFYGTNKKGEVLNSRALDLDLLLTALESDKIKNGGRLRKIAPDQPGVKGLRKNGFLQCSYSNNIETLSKAKNKHKVDYYNWLLSNKNNNAPDFCKLQSRVRLFSDFMNSETRLSYAQLVGLAQNLV